MHSIVCENVPSVLSSHSAIVAPFHLSASPVREVGGLQTDGVIAICAFSIYLSKYSISWKVGREFHISKMLLIRYAQEEAIEYNEIVL